ncbi:nitroreductase family protein [Acidothermaceae bacterium B102]|nr:nitroreductase family protein [Acidothermaceae bacterium B102]
MPTLLLTPDELLTTTRAVRKRLDLTRPVPIALIRECLEIALQAPSGANRQRWHWMVVVDPGVRKQIAEIYLERAQNYAASDSYVSKLYADDPERSQVQQRVGDSTEYLAEHMGEVPVLVIPCLKAGELRAGNQASLWGSLLPATWSYMLAARSRGLGTAWTTLHLGREREVADLLGMPANIHQAAIIPTAYYTGGTFKRAPRDPLDTVLHIDKW